MTIKSWHYVIFIILFLCFRRSFSQQMDAVSGNGIVLVKDQNGIIPFRQLDTLSFASLAIGVDSCNVFQKFLGKYAPVRHYQLNDISIPENDYKFLSELSQFNIVIISFHGLLDDSLKNFGIHHQDIEFVKKIAENTTTVLTIFGPAESLVLFKDFDHLLYAGQNNDRIQKNASQVLFGALPAKGKLPVSISDDLPAGSGIPTDVLRRLSFSSPEISGMDSRTFQYIDSLATEMIMEGAAPGCQIVICRKGNVVYDKCFGYHTYDSLIRVDDRTLYDLASVTKIASTIQLFMFLYGIGIVDLDKKASFYLPELKGTNKEDIIIRDLLTHYSGLKPYIPFYTYTLKGKNPRKEFYSTFNQEGYSQKIVPGMYSIPSLKDSVWQWTIDSELREKEDPLKPYDYQYSDMGYYVLMHIAEALIQQPMDEFLEQNFFDPLGLHTITYNPLSKFPSSQIAPTEADRYYRNTLLQGLVHDESAAMYGGVAGHAGLFSSALDLAILMQMNLQDGYYGGNRYLVRGVIDVFTEKQYITNRRGIGWDKPETRPKEYNPVSWFASPETYGHSGFTGTCVWVDPEYELIYVFLSNRIYPDRENNKLIDLDFRLRIQNILYDSIFNYQKD